MPSDQTGQLQAKIDNLEAELRTASRDLTSSRDSTKYDVEIARLTKERDLTRYSSTNFIMNQLNAFKS